MSLALWMTNGIDTALLTLWPPALGLKIQEKVSRVFVGHCPHVSTLCLPDVTTHDQLSQAFPLCICILQVIKYWRWERTGNEARWWQQLTSLATSGDGGTPFLCQEKGEEIMYMWEDSPVVKCIYQSIYKASKLADYLSTYVSIYYLFIYLSIYLFIYLST